MAEPGEIVDLDHETASLEASLKEFKEKADVAVKNGTKISAESVAKLVESYQLFEGVIRSNDAIRNQILKSNSYPAATRLAEDAAKELDPDQERKDQLKSLAIKIAIAVGAGVTAYAVSHSISNFLGL